MKYRIVNRYRFIAFVVISIIMITCLANIMLNLNEAHGLEVIEYKTYEVSAGETLWSIASTYVTDQMDIRKAVYELSRINDIDASQLYAGMTIQVPIYK